MKNITFVYRPDSPQAFLEAKKLVRKFPNLQFYTSPGQKVVPGTKALKPGLHLKKMDLVLALGGDGTYLRAAQLVGEQGIPCLGINMGNLGFLTPTPEQNSIQALKKTLENRMRIVPRALLEVKVQVGKKKQKFLALNDVVLERGRQSQIIRVGVETQKQLIDEVRADAIIVATPTGSTAYNLASGGPLVHPDSNVMVLTAVSPHGLNHRPLVLPDDRDVLLRLTHGGSSRSQKSGAAGAVQEAQLVVDGRVCANLGPGDKVYLKKAMTEHKMIRDPELTYFDLLRAKLRFGGHPSRAIKPR